jgi:hypothetical protein
MFGKGIDGHKKREKSQVNALPCVAPIGARTVVAEAQTLFAIFVANRIGLWLRLRRATRNIEQMPKTKKHYNRRSRFAAAREWW